MSASDFFKHVAPFLDQTGSAIKSSPQILIVITGAFVAAILALLFNTVLEFIRRRILKESLLDLFIADIAATAMEIQSSSIKPLGEQSLLKLTMSLRGVDGLSFTGDPELSFEVFNVKLYETEGFKLAGILKSSTRREFWSAYKLMRDAESARMTLKEMSKDDPDRGSFEQLYLGLLKQLYTRLLGLSHALDRERLWFRFAPLK